MVLADYADFYLWVEGVIEWLPTVRYYGGWKMLFPGIDKDRFYYSDLMSMYAKAGGKASSVLMYFYLPGQPLDIVDHASPLMAIDPKGKIIENVEPMSALPIAADNLNTNYDGDNELINNLGVLGQNDNEGNENRGDERQHDIENWRGEKEIGENIENSSNVNQDPNELGIGQPQDGLETSLSEGDLGAPTAQRVDDALGAEQHQDGLETSLSEGDLGAPTAQGVDDALGAEQPQDGIEANVSERDQGDLALAEDDSDASSVSDCPSWLLEDLEGPQDDDIFAERPPDHAKKGMRSVDGESWYSDANDDDELHSLRGSDEDDINNPVWEDGMENRGIDLCVGMKFINRHKYREVLRDWAVRRGWDLRYLKIERDYKYIGKRILHFIEDNPDESLESLKNKIKRDIQVECSFHKVYKAKRYALDLLRRDISQGYKLLYDYRETVVRKNPISSMVLKVDRSCNPPILERMYCCLSGLTDGFLDGCRQSLSQIGGDKFEVKHFLEKHVVYLDEQCCSCGMFQLAGYPCCHAMGALAFFRREAEDYENPSLMKDVYLRVYSHGINPVPEMHDFDESSLGHVDPPHVKPRVGRPTKKRRRDGNDNGASVGTREGLTHTCSICHEQGHNKAGHHTHTKQNEMPSTATEDEGKSEAGIRAEVPPKSSQPSSTASQSHNFSQSSVSLDVTSFEMPDSLQGAPDSNQFTQSTLPELVVPLMSAPIPSVGSQPPQVSEVLPQVPTQSPKSRKQQNSISLSSKKLQNIRTMLNPTPNPAFKRPCCAENRSTSTSTSTLIKFVPASYKLKSTAPSSMPKTFGPSSMPKPRTTAASSMPKPASTLKATSFASTLSRKTSRPAAASSKDKSAKKTF
ncbi:hypothetical protein BUALT_Bualt10G0059600 [Buddleja alternifolia]|uniref:SWIM-type domain-containing protein n=1 Tax=Buddleja alternifolia TaxID=168488 RepID=A0AAV6WX64_9LAMI|nr:hypothetical protein BUALT_Bualt10G0059600 [Buddleja alternifolia]